MARKLPWVPLGTTAHSGLGVGALISPKAIHSPHAANHRALVAIARRDMVCGKDRVIELFSAAKVSQKAEIQSNSEVWHDGPGPLNDDLLRLS